MADAGHRLTIFTMTVGAGSSTALTFHVTEEHAQEAIGQLADPNAVLRFDTLDGFERPRGATLIPVRMVTHVGYDTGP